MNFRTKEQQLVRDLREAIITKIPARVYSSDSLICVGLKQDMKTPASDTMISPEK